MEQGIDPAFYTQIIVQSVTLEIAKLRCIPFQSKTKEQYKDICFNKGGNSEGDKVLETLDKKYYISIIYILSDQNYLNFSIYIIKIKVEVAKVSLILSFG